MRRPPKTAIFILAAYPALGALAAHFRLGVSSVVIGHFLLVFAIAVAVAIHSKSERLRYAFSQAGLTQEVPPWAVFLGTFALLSLVLGALGLLPSVGAHWLVGQLGR